MHSWTNTSPQPIHPHIHVRSDRQPGWLVKGTQGRKNLASRRAFRSSARGKLLVPRARSALKQCRAFSVIGTRYCIVCAHLSVKYVSKCRHAVTTLEYTTQRSMVPVNFASLF